MSSADPNRADEPRSAPSAEASFAVLCDVRRWLRENVGPDAVRSTRVVDELLDEVNAERSPTRDVVDAAQRDATGFGSTRGAKEP